MQRAVKQENVQYQDFSDFSKGWNCRTSPENIEINELTDVNNMSFADEPGRLRTRHGIGTALKVFTNNIDGAFAWHNVVVVRADNKYWIVGSNNVFTELGAALGNGVPSFCEYDGKLYVCADSNIQKIVNTGTGYSLSTLGNSPSDMTGLFAREGRLCGWESGRENSERKDYIIGSMVGDPDSADSWTVGTTDLAAVEYQIGYKVAGAIVGVVPFLTDLVVFKENAVMRFAGTMIPSANDAAVYEVARNERLANKDSVQNVGGLLYYIDKLTGVRMIQSTDAYGDMLPEDVVPRVNPYIRDNVDFTKCRLWHLKNKKIVAIGLGDVVVPAYYEYATTDTPCLKWSFSKEVKSIVETDDGNVYIAAGNKLFRAGADDDEGKGVHCSFATKKLVASYMYLLRRIFAHIDTTDKDTPVMPHWIYIYCGGTKIAQVRFSSGINGIYYLTSYVNPEHWVYDNEQGLVDNAFSKENELNKHQTFRTQNLQIIFDNANEGTDGETYYSSPFVITRLSIEYAPVGVIS